MIKKTSAIILTVSLVILVASSTFANILEQELDESTLKILLTKGELILLEEENGELKYITMAILIDTPLDKVWQVLTDFEKYPDFIPGHKDCKIIKKDNNEITVESAVEFKFMVIGSTVRYTTKYILKKPELIIIDTEINRETGRYKLIPIDEGKRVVLFRTKEAVDVDNFGRVAKFLVIQKPEMEFSLYLSPLRINMNAIKERAEKS
ncbi:MAG: SRPBCC family protein [Candidatus Cloacimonetes bacterium]|nr:SRPBCC family protein [Candidatus Cloacimonadota bacterium]